MTIEDPIEYLHGHKMCIVNQREIGADTASFKDALKYVLRQDPDVVLIGEMRNLETIEAALTIAETGHLVFATLHTNSAVSSINRIIDVFPAFQQSQVRAQLSFTLAAVMTQVLLPRASGSGRALAMEVMIPNAAIKNLIREDKLHQIYSQMQMGQGGSGMQTMNQTLYGLVQRRVITSEVAYETSNDADELRAMFRRPRHGRPAAGPPAPLKSLARASAARQARGPLDDCPAERRRAAREQGSNVRLGRFFDPVIPGKDQAKPPICAGATATFLTSHQLFSKVPSRARPHRSSAAGPSLHSSVDSRARVSSDAA